MDITHTGRVKEITPEWITVEIVSESACSACHAASLCSLSESTTKEIRIPFDFRDWAIGEEVEVCLKKSMGYKAVWISYVAPLFLMFATILGTSACGVSELFCGLAGIGAVAVYYLVIFLFRDRLRNEYTFYINKK